MPSMKAVWNHSELTNKQRINENRPHRRIQSVLTVWFATWPQAIHTASKIKDVEECLLIWQHTQEYTQGALGGLDTRPIHTSASIHKEKIFLGRDGGKFDIRNQR